MRKSDHRRGSDINQRINHLTTCASGWCVGVGRRAVPRQCCHRDGQQLQSQSGESLTHCTKA